MKKVVTFGEILMRLATDNHERFTQADHFALTFGGGEANVAISLVNYGQPVDYITRLPDNDIGITAKSALKKHGVGVDKIIPGGKRLGIYFLETGAVSRGSKVVYDREDSSFATLETGMIDWDAALEGAGLFHWSGLSAAISQGAYDVLAEGVRAASDKGIPITCDINLRSKLWNYGKTPNDVMPDLIALSDVVFGNEFDAEHAMGIEVDDSIRDQFTNKSFLKAAKLVMQKYPKVKKMITTRRGSISASDNTLVGLMYNRERLIKSHTFNITHIVDRVGGGDAFAGAMIYGLINWPHDDKESLNYAVGASALKHTIYGDINRVTADEVKEWMYGVGRIAW